MLCVSIDSHCQNMSNFRIVYLVFYPIGSIWVVECFYVGNSTTNLHENQVTTQLALIVPGIIKSHSEGSDDTCHGGRNSWSCQCRLRSIDLIDRYSDWQATIFNRISWPTASRLNPNLKCVLSSHTDCVANLISTSCFRIHRSTEFVARAWQTNSENIVLVDLKIAVDVPSENSVHLFYVDYCISRMSWVVKMALCLVCRSWNNSEGIWCLLWV